MSSKPRLLCHVTHPPLLESCYPILERLHARGRVTVDLVMDRRLPRVVPALPQVLDAADMPVRFLSRLSIELMSYSDIASADAVLVHTDPFGHFKRGRLRDRFIPWSGTPSIFLQHGMMQIGVNYAHGDSGCHWYSGLLLWWEDFDSAKSDFIQDDIRERVRTVGWIKRSFVPPQPFPERVQAFLSGFRKRVLVATCFPGQSFRFTEETLTGTYAMFHEFCRRNPDVLLIVRPHRGKQDARGKALDAELSALPNVVVMDRYSGDFAYSTMHDSLAISDAVISHASSAVLDAVYEGKPTAVLQNDWASLDGLPQVTTLDELEAFVAASDQIDPNDNDVIRHFGHLDANLDRACEAIEEFLLATR